MPWDERPSTSGGGSTAFDDAKYKHVSEVSTVSIAAAEVVHKWRYYKSSAEAV